MLGTYRQAMVCSSCKYTCHSSCISRLTESHASCPQAKDLELPSFVSPKNGVGTAYEGDVKIPKPGGIRKGWRRVFLVVSDYRLQFFEWTTYGKKNNTTETLENAALYVIDLRDPNFQASLVATADVIHATAKETERIFKVTYQQSSRAPPFELIVLAKDEKVV